ncbi:MAG: aldehyde dehydrogenase family protein, partial [Planctomycetota bacterium]
MALKIVGNYVDGEWFEPENDGYIDVENPSTGQIIARTPLSTAAETNRAIDAAAEAFRDWSQTPVARRIQPLYQLDSLLRENEEKIARTLVEEMGKSLPDARAEMKRIFENIEVACGMPVMQQGDKLIGSSYDIDGEVIRLPIGVFAMIAPFNFPAMVPFWFLPYAIATGNTYVLKASEQVPLTMQLITEYIDRIGLPKGVFNLVNGDKVVGRTLVENPLVKGVSLVGATPTCKMVSAQCAQNVSLVGATPTCKMVSAQCAQNHKRCQAMGSAKNHLVAMPDAKIDDMLRNMITSCYGCAGQRCMAASAIVAVGDDMYKTVCEKFVEASKGVLVTDPLDPKVADEPMVMGPVISAQSKQFIHGMIETGLKEGAALALDGRDIVVPACENGHFVGPTVFT